MVSASLSSAAVESPVLIESSAVVLRLKLGEVYGWVVVGFRVNSTRRQLDTCVELTACRVDSCVELTLVKSTHGQLDTS